MIKSYQIKQQELFQRLKDKTKSQSFINFIKVNTNLSVIESEVVFNEFYNSFLFNNNKNIQPMQTKFIAIKISAGHGRKLKDSDLKEIILTLHDNADENIRHDRNEFANKYNFNDIDSITAVRRNKILRLTQEAVDQQAVLTEEDLAYKLLNCSLRTIQRDIKAFKETGIMIPIRGVVCDIGKSITHKVEIVRSFLKMNNISKICREKNHSKEAIERYLNKFLQVSYSLEQGLKKTEISFLTKSSYSLIEEYEKLYREAKENKSIENIDDFISKSMKTIRFDVKKRIGGKI